MNIDVISPYNHFPHHNPEPGEECPRMYCDGSIFHSLVEPKRSNDTLLLIEPRSLQPESYNKAMLHYDRFRYIFTHDSQLLSFAPNAKPIWYWRDYELKDVPKTKNISMICGTKDMCPIHHERMKLADAIKDRVDVLGDYTGPRCTIDEAYSEYRFAVVIENYRDDWWFTEKVLNAFSHKTIPIYYGARNLGYIFDDRGFIHARKLWDIPDIIDILIDKGLREEYYRRQNVIRVNYEAVQRYKNFEDYFFSEYGSLMEVIGGES